MDKTEYDDEITPLEAAKILKVNPGTLANWRVQGVGPDYQKTGDGPRGHVRYSRSEVREFARTMKRVRTRK